MKTIIAAVIAAMTLMGCGGTDTELCEETCSYKWPDGGDPYDSCVEKVCTLKEPAGDDA